MRWVVVVVALVLTSRVSAQPSRSWLPTPMLCQEMDAPACTAWVVAGAGPVAVVGLAVGIDAMGAPEVGLGVGLSAFAMGPAAGYVAAGHGRAALPGLALRAAATGVTTILALTVLPQGDGLAGDLFSTLLLLGPGTAVVLVSSRHDSLRLRRMLQDDTSVRAARRPLRVTAAPATGGFRVWLFVPV